MDEQKVSEGLQRHEANPPLSVVKQRHLPSMKGKQISKAGFSAGFLTTTRRGSEVILLVEDEETIRMLSRIILQKRGYVVLDARNGREGLALCAAHQGPIDLLLTDVVMPELDGPELAESAVKLRPALKVMFMSGYAEGHLSKRDIQRGTFLQKPFPAAALVHKVRETLDSSRKAPMRP